MTETERFWAKVTRGTPTECWTWNGSKRTGYGRFSITRRKAVPAHRFAYELLVGKVPDGLTLDHLCRNRACVNPAHLEPVTGRVNTLRGIGLTAINARKTHCLRGHEYTPENTRYRPDGSRRCWECHRIHDARARAVRKERAAA